MKITTESLWALTALCLLPQASSAPNCPLQGPSFPIPTNLASHPTMQAAFANLTALFTHSDKDNTTGASDVSYSLEVFSTSDHISGDGTAATPIFSRYYMAPSVPANTTGVRTVDGHTVFRLGSLTKVFTVYTLLREVGDACFLDPVGKYVPEIAALAAAGDAKRDPVGAVDWDSVTIGSIAAQITGLMRDYAQVGEITQTYTLNQSTIDALGFPRLPNASIPTCGQWPLCNRTQFFEGMKHVIPSFAPYQTATYSDFSWQILAYALETMKGRKFEDMLRDDVLKPLGLDHTFLFAPDERLGVIPEIPEKAASTGWNYSLGEGAATGNMYSSASDLSTFGRAILSSSHLPGPMTRRWLKPAVLTSELVAGIGYPWGVRRIPVPANNGKRVVDAYSKAGGIGAYRSLMVLLPDYGVGYSGLWAGMHNPTNTNWAAGDVLSEVLLPALEQTAREQAQERFGGTYVAEGANSSIVISTQNDRPGLGVDSWVNNGVDMKAVAVGLTGGYDVRRPSIRLYPTLLETVNADQSRRIAFKAVFEDLDLPTVNKMLSTDCGSWVIQTAVTYGELPLDQFVFNVDKNGRTASIEPLALRVSLLKQS